MLAFALRADGWWEQIKHEICGLIDNYWKNIASAFVKSGYELAISIKVELGREDGANTIVPVVEFYPEKKTKSVKYKVRVNEKQIGLFDAKKSA